MSKVYVVDGEACFETPARASELHKGETLAVAAGTSMRALVTGSTRRHVLAVIVHDSARPGDNADGRGNRADARRVQPGRR